MPASEELARLGIEKEIIVSYSPQQNGISEATNKILISKVRKNIHHFNDRNHLPLLKFIFEYRIYFINYTPSFSWNRPTLPQIAYNGSRVDGNNYHMFGVDVIVKLNNGQEARTDGAVFGGDILRSITTQSKRSIDKIGEARVCNSIKFVTEVVAGWSEVRVL